jgi:hypothetical protein
MIYLLAYLALAIAIIIYGARTAPLMDEDGNNIESI